MTGSNPPAQAADLLAVADPLITDPLAADLLDAIAAQPARHALFFDVDGTLLDIAPEPEAVFIPPGLTEDAARLRQRYGGAVALLSGRSIAWLDGRFSHAIIAIGGLHGLERRADTGMTTALAPPAFLADARAAIAHLAAKDVRLLVEDKGLAIAVHFRAAPERAEEVGALLAQLAKQSEGAMQSIPGKNLFELRTSGADKGTALAAFMAEAPFKGRTPVFFGDDRTDEDGFRVVLGLNGIAMAVGREAADVGATASLPGPAAVRAFLARAAA